MLSFAIVPVEAILAHVYAAKRVMQNFHSNQTGQTIKSRRNYYFITYRQRTRYGLASLWYRPALRLVVLARKTSLLVQNIRTI